MAKGKAMRTEYSYERASRLPIPKKPKYSLCFVTYIGETDWYTERPTIRDISFRTMLEGVNRDECEVMVWNNGGIHRLDADYNIESVNIGNWNARRNMLLLARGDIVCLTDDDILFSKDWLQKQVEILQTYPNVGFVHGSPTRVRHRDRATVEWAQGKIINTTLPTRWQTDFALARSYTPYYGEDDACLCEYNGVRAWACALDQQFIGRRDVLLRYYNHETPILFDKSAMNERVSNDGYLCFSTENRTAIHMGNVIDDSVIGAAKEMGVVL